MKKKISLITMILLVLIIATGCSAKGKIETTVSEFSGAMKEFDLEVMASKISPEDSEGRDEINGLNDEEGAGDSLENKLVDYVKSNAAKIGYRINETVIDGDRATVSVGFKYVDGTPIFSEALTEYMQQAFTLLFSNEELTDEESDQMLADIVKKKSVQIEESFIEKTLDIKMIKVDSEWYIEKFDDEMLNIVLSNLPSAVGNLENSLGAGGEDLEGLDDFTDIEDVGVDEE